MTATFNPNPLSFRAHSSGGKGRLRGADGAPNLCPPPHGDFVGTVSRSGSGSYSLGGERVYDAWGLKHGSADSQQRYCANLGHRQDDETGTYTGGSPDGDGLVYMRARYYEPETGRFISEDSARDGWNWYVYCGNDPLNAIDPSGNEEDSVTATLRNLALRALTTGDWDGFVDLLDTIVNALRGGAAEASEGGMEQSVVDALESVPKPVRGFAPGISRFAKAYGLFNRMVEHIVKVLENPGARDTGHWLKEIQAFLKGIYRLLDK